MKKLIAWIVVLILVCTLIPTVIPITKASPNTWYVALYGSDTTGDGSIGNPFASLRKAVNRAVDGNNDVIYLRGGNYNNVVPTTSSGFVVNKSHLTIKAYNNERVILNAAGKTITGYNGFINIYAPRTNITFEDVSFENLTIGSGGVPYCVDINAEGGTYISDISIIHCQFRNIIYYAILSWDPAGHIYDTDVHDCYFYKIQTGASTGECIGLTGRGVKFYNNSLRYCQKIGVDFVASDTVCYNNSVQLNMSRSGEGIYVDCAGKNLRNISIFNNVVWGHPESLPVSAGGINICGETAGKLENVYIYNNVVNLSDAYLGDPYNDFIYGIGIKKENIGTLSYFWNVTIKHNTVFIGKGAGRAIHVEPPVWRLHNITIDNNILVTNESANPGGRSQQQIYFQNMHWGDATEGNVTLKNNLYYYANGVAVGEYWQGTTHVTATNFIANPKFVDITGWDFMLQGSSPAIDSANATRAYYVVATDFLHKSRPQGAGYDIGAVEFEMGISNVKITPNPQQTGGYVNISCTVASLHQNIEDVWINIIYPDHTAHNYSMTPSYYYNQTYVMLGTYRFFIGARDTNGNSTSSVGHTFYIIPPLRPAFLLGLITNIDTTGTSMINFDAKIVISIGVNPFSVNVFSSGEKVFASWDTLGYIGKKIIVGVFDIAVLAEKRDNFPSYHQILITADENHDSTKFS